MWSRDKIVDVNRMLMNRIIDPILINFNIFDILVFVESDDKP